MSHEPDWYDELAADLRSRKAGRARTAEIVDEAKAHCAATGERPSDAFGDTHTYAARLTSDHDPDETRFQRVAEGYVHLSQPIGYRLLTSFGTSLAVVSLLGWLVDDTWRALTMTDLVTWLVLFTWVFFAQLRDEIRQAGHPGAARWMFAGGLIAVTGCVGVATYLPTKGFVRVPLPGLLLLGALLLAAGWWLGSRWEKTHHPLTWLTRDAWLDRLAGLLEGRYRIPAAKARELRAEAASHLAESGGEPEQEFGPVDDYAAELAERSGLRRRQKSWPAWVWLTFAAVVFGGFTVQAIDNGGIVNVRSGILAAITVLLASSAVRSFSGRRATPHASRR